MPELPEVESTRRYLIPFLELATIQSVDVARPRMLRRQPPGGGFAERLVGRTVTALSRHGKLLLALLDDGVLWATHLGMSGRMAMSPSGSPPLPHTQLSVGIGPLEVRMIDPRTFGYFAALAPFDPLPHAGWGPDALTDLPSSTALANLLAGRRAPVKALLLDQRFLAGIGNIYADEALWRAGIRPARPGGALCRDEVKRLRRGIVVALNAGLAAGGTTLDDLAYLLPDGRAAGTTLHLKAYGREGKHCRRCRGRILRTTIRQRSSFYCGSCQA